MNLPRSTATAWLAWVIFVVYGSLLPFDFHALALDAAMARFQQLPFLKVGVESRADWVANGVLYLPVGALAARWLATALGPHCRWLAVVIASVGGVLLATAVEFAQLYFPPRTVSQNDLIAESLGSLLGAMGAPMLQPWAAGVREAWRRGGPRFLLRSLEVYVLGYVGLSLFPYDLLLSAQEWHGKLSSDNCGVLLARSSLERGWLVVPLLAIESMLAVPFGLLLALWRRPRITSIGVACLSGAALGLLIEGGQLATASGIAQGLSIATRAAGVALGAWLVTQPGHGVPWLRHRLHRHAGPVTAAYLLLLLAANGWFNHPFRDLAAAQTQWVQLRLMPFYYHYYTTEAAAVFSLGSVALMYLPVALSGWARWRPVGADLLTDRKSVV